MMHVKTNEMKIYDQTSSFVFPQLDITAKQSWINSLLYIMKVAI